MLAAILALVAAGLFFILINQALFAILCLLAAILVAVASFFSKTKTTAERIGKSGTKGMKEGLWKAETGHPDKSILNDAVSGAGETTGIEIGAPNGHKLKTTGTFGDAASKIIETFKKAFK